MTALVTVLTLLSLAVVVATRIRLRGTPSLVLLLHTGCGLVGAVVWLVFLAAPSSSSLGGALTGVIGLGLWWIVAVAGLALMTEHLSGGGRRAASARSAVGRVLWVLLHLGVLAAWLVNSWAYADSRV